MKEIAAMKKQPEYEYVKVTESIFDLKDDFESGALYWANDQGCAMEYIKVYTNDVQMLAKQYENNNLYRHIELTPERKKEKEVEELTLILSEVMLACNYRDDEPLAAAKAALEWMESKEIRYA